MFHSIYIAGAEPRSGKSIIVLGMMEMLRAMTPRVGFFRPVVKENNGHDPLIHLISKRYGLTTSNGELYGCTREVVRKMVGEGRLEELLKLILAKYRAIQEKSDIVVCAGADFSEINASLELDFNATLANHFGCLFLPVVKGYGRTAEEIADAVRILEEHLEGEQHCELLAAFANRVPVDQVDDLNARLKGSRFPFFVLPERYSLERPTVGEIARELRLECLYGTPQSFNHEVSRYKVAAMQVQDFLGHLENCSMVITPGDRSDIILGTLAADISSAYPMIAGMILTGGQRPAADVSKLLEGMNPLRLPILLSPWDTFETSLKVNAVEGTILPSNERKIAVALGLMESCVDMHQLRQLIMQNPGSRMTPLMFEYDLIQRAKSQRKRIVLPESTDERVLRAAEILSLRDVVDITLLGDENEVRAQAAQLGLKLRDVAIVNPRTSAWRKEFADIYYELRKHKCASPALAWDTMVDVSYFGTMMVYLGYADGMVSGAVNTTQHTIRPAFEVIKTKPGCNLVSSVFFMCLEDRVLVYGDCAVNPNPNAEQLADIAVTSSDTARMFGIEPRTAMLSYSSGESGKGADVERVRTAVQIAHGRRPELKLDGPIQYDAAVDLSVASSKMPNSEVAGKATVFIFPDLNTGNNTYKAVQRSANAVAIGPVLQGLNKPVNDLSRGCTVTDIVNTVVITAIQAQQGNVA
ncbi:phosphate acetyltransferase [Candidatus Thiothrix sp. Deng01]|uniref:Phosphate acetyltransferase n=1 Tax=Candidatus Thiothrix phosphatis TaxID=3112415 RepID=A0ABU6CUZ0_9GAMM|nr:phosphate acetyltransferase [Candidatus Thiothrix sp. Deng01]MEB4589897.1 phosphate acetyltransferase [Candidatus Thiothrix sp. Deng01]